MTLRHLLVVPALALSLGIAPHARDQKAAPGPKVEVFKTATCGCCGKWVEHLKTEGFDVTYKDIEHGELNTLKEKYGVPREAHSCHTALVGSYVIEGHVPASEVKKLLKERPSVVGLAVPGMPLGSPGMEVSGVKPRPYDVLSIDKQGRTTVFSTIRP